MNSNDNKKKKPKEIPLDEISTPVTQSDPDFDPVPNKVISNDEIKKLKKLPKDELVKLVAEVQFMASIHSGPIPSPNDLAAYENIHPGLADRIVAMAEKKSESNIRNNNAIVDLEKVLRPRGQLLGTFIVFCFMVLSGFLILKGETLAAILTLAGELGALYLIWSKSFFDNEDK